MPDKKSILIADPDSATLRTLRDGLREDFELILCKDGSRALEQAVLKYPDLIMFARNCPLISAAQFLRILRANPRTEEIPLIILSDAPMSTESVARSFLQGVLVKPLNLDEVRAHLAVVLRKVETARHVGGEHGTVSGSLDQISMVDLLQVFSINRRSGCLQLRGGPDGAEAAVFLHDGRIEDATVGAARAEKALYRLLTWTGGGFSFVPGQRAPAARISASTDSLLMEGLRQGDELGRMKEDLPAGDAVVERSVPPDGLPEGLHPITAEIFQLAEHYPRVSDLVDRAAATDMEVSVALRALLDANLLRVGKERMGGSGAVLAPDDVLDLRSRLRSAGLAPSFLRTPRVAVVSANPSDVWRFGVGLSRLPAFAVGDLERLNRLAVGSLGHLALDRSLSVEFYAVAAEERLLPLAYGLSAGTIAAVVLGTGNLQACPSALVMLEEARRAPLLFVRWPGDPMLAGEEDRAVVEIEPETEDWAREVLSVLLTRVSGTDLRGVGL
jgi:CheY-like chemotaxis protein